MSFKYKKLSDINEKEKLDSGSVEARVRSVDTDLNIKKPPEKEWKPETQNIVKKAKTDKTLDDKEFLSQKRKREAALSGLTPDEARKILNVLSSKNKDSY